MFAKRVRVTPDVSCLTYYWERGPLQALFDARTARSVMGSVEVSHRHNRQPVFDDVLLSEQCVRFPDGSQQPFDEQVQRDVLGGLSSIGHIYDVELHLHATDQCLSSGYPDCQFSWLDNGHHV